MSDKSGLIDSRQAAEIATVSPQTVRRWVDQGILIPAFRLPGGRYRFRRADVEALLAPKSAEPIEASA